MKQAGMAVGGPRPSDDARRIRRSFGCTTIRGILGLHPQGLPESGQRQSPEHRTRRSLRLVRDAVPPLRN